MMKVLHVHSGNLYGGVETFLLTLARARRFAPGMEMSVALCFDGRIADELRGEGVALFFVGEVRLRRPDQVRRARKALRALLAAHAFDVVVCHQAWPLAIFGPVVKRAGIRLAAWVHMAQTGRHWLERLAGRIEPDCFVCNSHFTASELPPTRARVEVVYYPVEPITAPGSRSPQPGKPVAIIQVSRMEPSKGQAILIEALSRLRGDPRWTCAIVGGPQRPVEARYFESLQTSALRSGIGDRVTFMGQRADVPALLASADLFCQPNLGPEAFGISFVEALAAGLPVVTSAMGGALEIVDETCGILVPHGDAAALAGALSQLVDDAARREQLGRRGPDRARLLCGPAVQVNRIAAVFESIAHPRAVVP